ncbi:MAG: J domain-containing protein, partial [Arenimonas sp.]|uniref:J domain-containing protein n=1 Tax=Arenimonas sp. TaxID=1872635 RepID=UPI003C1165D1
MSASPALQQALRLRGQPDLLTSLQRAPLPPDMTGLIRIVTGESAATDAERSAAAAFLEQVCLHAGAEPRRCLALQAHDDLVTARSHHRLLIKWLHPDRNPGTQDLAERVNSAWTALKNPQPLPPGTAPDLAVTPSRRSRFPVFLGVLLLAALALLALSLLPDAPVYVDAPAQAEAPVQPAPDAAMARASAAMPPETPSLP